MAVKTMNMEEHEPLLYCLVDTKFTGAGDHLGPFDLTSFGSRAFNAASEGATDLQYTFHVRSQMRSLALELKCTCIVKRPSYTCAQLS